MKKYHWILVLLWTVVFSSKFLYAEEATGELISKNMVLPAVAASTDSIIPFETYKYSRFQKGVLNMPFASEKLSRGEMDYPITLDATRINTVYLDVEQELSQVEFSSVVLYFHSGDGWYSMPGDCIQLQGENLYRYTFLTANCRTEGDPGPLSEVDRIRLAFYPRSNKDSSIKLLALTTPQPTMLLICQEDQPSYSQSICNILSSEQLNCQIIPMNQLTMADLKRYSIAILPYQDKMSEKTTDLLCQYLDEGGFLIACYTMPETLLNKMGFGPGTYVRMSDIGVKLAEMRVDSHCASQYAHLFPKAIFQNSHNITVSFPRTQDDPLLPNDLKSASNQPYIAAWWYNSDGEKTKYPAILASGRGFYISHVLYGNQDSNKAAFLQAICLKKNADYQSTYLHRLWYNFLEQGRSTDSPETYYSREIPSILEELGKKEWTAETLLSLLKKKDNSIDQISKFTTDLKEVAHMRMMARTKAVGSRADEGRYWWEHSGLGAYPGNWDRTMKELSEAGFNGIMVNMQWGGSAHYESAYLPAHNRYVQYGDQVEQAVKAGKKYGVEVHVWKVNYNAEYTTSTEFMEKMQKEGRLQQSITGEVKKWLCPSHPANKQLEADAMLEVAKKYNIDGIHFDYIRYDGAQFCFCEGCRNRFGQYWKQKYGSEITNLIESIKKDPKVKEEFQTWRREQITSLVRMVRERVDRECPQIKISAAVFRDYPNCRDGVGQDWVEWAKRGYLDFVCPMNYSNNDTTFMDWTKTQKEALGNSIPFYPGIGLSSSSSRLQIDQVAKQIKLTRDLGAQGFTIFSLTPYNAEYVLPLFKSGPTVIKSIPPHLKKKGELKHDKIIKAIPDNGVTAHRGDSVNAPENTIDAFKAGIKAGADWIETDVYCTSDGKLVLCHDASMKRTSGVNLDIARSTWSELSLLDVAFQYRNIHGLTIQKCPPQRMPLLEEAIDLILKEKKARLSLQPKMDCVDKIAAVIKKMKAEDWVGFNDGNLSYMSRAKELLPSAVIFWDRSPNFEVEKDIAVARDKKFDALVVHFTSLTPEKISKIQKAGLVVGAWTVDDEKEMEKLLKMGVERIYTDDPNLLLQVKAKILIKRQ